MRRYDEEEDELDRFGANERTEGRFAMTRRDRAIVEESARDAERYLRTKRDPESGGRTRMKKTDLALTVLGGIVAAGGVGLLAGRLGTTSIPKTGVPLGLAAGAAALVPVALNVVPDKFESVLFGAGLGALAAWVNMWGAGQGAQMARTPEDQGPRVIAAGMPAAAALPGANPGSKPLSEAELVNMMQRYG